MARNRRKKDWVYVPNPKVNNILTVIYIALSLLVIVTLFTLTKPGDGPIFTVMLGVTAAAVKTCEWSSRTFGGLFSRTVLGHAPFNDPLASKKTMTKFVGTVWQFAIHASMVVFELYCLAGETWWQKPWTTFEPIPQYYVTKESLRYFYLTQLAIWIYTCFSHRFDSDAHMHSDYFVMYSHHIATIALVGLSYYFNYTRIGLIILFVHDLSDIPVDVLKMVNYLKLEDKHGFFLSEIAFVLNLISWAYLRLNVFPTQVIYQGSLTGNMVEWPTPEGGLSFMGNVAKDFGNPSDELTKCWISGVVANTLLLTLQCMHFYWFLLFLRILRGILTEGAHNAGKSEYEGNSATDKDE